MTPPPAADTPMTHARLRLIVAAALFCAWIGWLAYLALTTTRPVVLSRAQFLASQLDAVATVAADAAGRPDPNVKVERVVWPENEAAKKPEGASIHVANL